MNLHRVSVPAGLAALLAWIAALASSPAPAFAQAWEIRVTNPVTPQNPVTTVEVYARYGPPDYAFAGGQFDVIAEEGVFFDPQVVAPFTVGGNPGTPAGNRVNGIVVSQLHFPSGGIFANPGNPILVWRAQWTKGRPGCVRVETATRQFQVYVNRNTPEVQSRLPGLAEGRGGIPVGQGACIDLIINSFSPSSGGCGDLVTISGRGFGNNPDNICLVLDNGAGALIGLNPESVTDTQIRARLPRFDPDSNQLPHRVKLALGEGARVAIQSAGASAIPLGLAWSWAIDHSIPPAMAPGFFTPVCPPPTLPSFHSGGPMSGSLMVTLDQDWGACTRFTITARIATAGNEMNDTQFQNVVFAASGTRAECAAVICDLIENLFAAHPTRPLLIDCSVTTVGPDAKITITVPGTTIVAGTIDIVQLAPCSSCTADIKRLSTPLVAGKENVAELVRYQVNTTGAAPTSFQWAVEAPIVEDFDERVNTGYTTDPMDLADFTNQQIQYYWKPHPSQVHPGPGTPVNRRISVVVQTATGVCADSMLVPVHRNTGEPSGAGQPVDYYMAAHGGRVLPEHASWHFGGFNTYSFFSFHRVILARYNAWRLDFGWKANQSWLPTTVPPLYPTDSEITPHTGRNASYSAALVKPTWFTLAGGIPTRPFGCGTPGEQKLADFANVGEVSCAVESPWHNQVHGGIGGVMNNANTAPSDGIFYRWHLGVDDICQDYESLSIVPPFEWFFTPYLPWSNYIDEYPPEVCFYFSKPVENVEAGLYSVNDSPATYVRGDKAGPYYFGGYDIPKTYGPIRSRLDPGNIIAPGSPPYQGFAFDYELVDGRLDHDGDGLPTAEEINTYNADPQDYDSDDDGLSDGEEVQRGTNLRNRLDPCNVGHLLLADPAGRRVMLLDQCNGSIVDPNFIAGDPVGMRVPFEAIQVHDAIWVSDQRANRIFRYDLAGRFVGSIPGEIDQVRGLEHAHGHVYAIHTEDANGAILHRVVRYMPNGVRMDAFQAGQNPYDVKLLHHDLLVTDINNEDILRFDPSGMPMGPFHNSDGMTGIDFPTQLADNRSGLAYGILLAGGFSAPTGIYAFDHGGGQTARYDTGIGVRGVYQLGNGNLLYTTDDGVYIFDVAAGLSSLVSPGRGMFINEVFGAEVSRPCYADCDNNKTLDIFDFLCFQNLYAANDPYACDCDLSSGPGQCDIFDFLCYQNAYAAGCP